MNDIRYACATHPGRVRLQNEDSYLADPANGFFIIADGMGGHQAGEVASKIVVKSVCADIRAGIPLDTALCNAHNRVLGAAEKGQGQAGMGATAVALKLDGVDYTIAWVGDSRAYLWSKELKQLTHDHSYVQELVDAGVLTAAEARRHPKRSIITRALGGNRTSAVEPEVVSGKLYRGQKILLCSDGLTSELEDGTIARIMERELSESNCVADLIQAANDFGGEDNTTVILVQSPLAAPLKEQGDTQPIDAGQIDRIESLGRKQRAEREGMIVGIICIFIVLAALWGYFFFAKTEKNDISSPPTVIPDRDKMPGKAPPALPEDQDQQGADQEEIIFHKVDE